MKFMRIFNVSILFIKFHIDPMLISGKRGSLTYWCYVVGSFNSFYACHGERAIGIALSMIENELLFFMRLDEKFIDMDKYLRDLKSIFINEILGSLSYDHIE